MIEFQDLDLIVRGASLGLLALWSWVLWRDHRHAFAARVALLLSATIMAHVIASIPRVDWRTSSAYVLLDSASASVFGLFWLFTRAWFEDVPRFGWRSWLIALAPSLIIAALALLRQEHHPLVDRLWFPLLRAIWFAFGIAGLWIAWRGREDDLIEGRRKLRLSLVLAIGGLALLINCVEIAVFRFGAPAELRSLTQFGIALAAVMVCAAMFRVRQEDLFGPIAAPAREAASPPADDPTIARLLAHMDAEKPHRDEGITIAALAGQLGEQEYRLRRLINGTLGHRNFAGFLNGFRLAEVKQALADPMQREVPILTIALDAGFGSLGPFNRAFRAVEGMTPSEYRRAALADSEID